MPKYILSSVGGKTDFAGGELMCKENIKSVIIPAQDNHDGVHAVFVRLKWVCPVCNKPRGEIKKTLSYDGSRYLPCDGWNNPCGHVDKYDAVRKEAAENGLN